MWMGEGDTCWRVHAITKAFFVVFLTYFSLESALLDWVGFFFQSQVYNIYVMFDVLLCSYCC